MLKLPHLSFVFCLLLAAAGCNQPKPAEQPGSPAAAADSVVDSAAALREQVSRPRVGDVYVVQFQRAGTAAPRYFFYHVFRATPDSAYLHPAGQDAATPDADLTQPALQPSTNTMLYSKAELLELLQEQPGDVNHARLVRVRRAE
jgi:hypothetical protein